MGITSRILPLPRDTWWERARGFLDYYRHPDRRVSWGGPFNGQVMRQRLFRDLVEAFDFPVVVETGTYCGTTTEFMLSASRAFIHTTEISPHHYGFCSARFLGNRRVRLYRLDSRALLKRLLPTAEFTRAPVFFYLDAHWFNDLPLNEEFRLILEHRTPAVIMIDDFEVEGDPGYSFDDYGGDRRLSLDYLTPLAGRGVSAFFPACPSAQETGARRGCVVWGTTEAINERLRSLKSLRPVSADGAGDPDVSSGRISPSADLPCL